MMARTFVRPQLGRIRKSRFQEEQIADVQTPLDIAAAPANNAVTRLSFRSLL
jgi:hypothetical protein